MDIYVALLSRGRHVLWIVHLDIAIALRRVRVDDMYVRHLRVEGHAEQVFDVRRNARNKNQKIHTNP